MFIQIEKTPDPEVLTFLPGRTVLGSGSLTFADADEAERSPLAARLMRISGIERVTLGADHVEAAKAGDADWQLLKPAVLGVIMEHFLGGHPILAAAPPAPAYDADDAELVAEIEALLDERIRPGLAEDGGKIAFLGYSDGVVELDLDGSGLAVPVFSIKIRIENSLRHYLPEIETVRFVETSAAPEDLDWDNPEVVAVHDLLEERVNPAVAAHGGHISLIDVVDHTAYIRLEGGCQGCGMADVTLKQGVEVMILENVPTITAVLDSTDHAGGTNPFFEPGKDGGFTPF